MFLKQLCLDSELLSNHMFVLRHYRVLLVEIEWTYNTSVQCQYGGQGTEYYVVNSEREVHSWSLLFLFVGKKWKIKDQPNFLLFIILSNRVLVYEVRVLVTVVPGTSTLRTVLHSAASIVCQYCRGHCSLPVVSLVSMICTVCCMYCSA